MSWKAGDTVLFLGLGALTFIAVKAVGYALRDVLTLTQIHDDHRGKQKCVISQETEDALNAQSLAVLAESHDRQTSEAAIRILADRFMRNNASVTSLTADIYNKDKERRAKGLQLLRMLEKYASDATPIQFLLEAQERSSTNAQLVSTSGGSLLREHEESFEEQELRRRRREAVIIHDGAGPISQDDIIQRSANGDTVHSGAAGSQARHTLRDTFADGAD